MTPLEARHLLDQFVGVQHGVGFGAIAPDFAKQITDDMTDKEIQVVVIEALDQVQGSMETYEKHCATLAEAFDLITADEPTVQDALRWTEWLCVRAEHGDSLNRYRNDMEKLVLDLFYSVINLARNDGVPVEHNIHSVNSFMAGVLTLFLEQEREA